MMFVPGAGITVTLHKVLTLHIIFAQTVDDDNAQDQASLDWMLPLPLCPSVWVQTRA